MAKARPLDFTDSKERSQWIVDNADYFTTFLLLNGEKYRDDWPTLAEAEVAAKRAANHFRQRGIMIYAVKGVENTWVKTVRFDGDPQKGRPRKRLKMTVDEPSNIKG